MGESCCDTNRRHLVGYNRRHLQTPHKWNDLYVGAIRHLVQCFKQRSNDTSEVERSYCAGIHHCFDKKDCECHFQIYSSADCGCEVHIICVGTVVWKLQFLMSSPISRVKHVVRYLGLFLFSRSCVSLPYLTHNIV